MSASEVIFSVLKSSAARYPARAWRFSIFTEAQTLTELKTMHSDALACHFTSGKPSVTRLPLVAEVIPA